MWSPLQAWRRRLWQADLAALAVFEGLRPVTVVTGGSEGIGFELARRFASAGHDLLLVARHRERLERAAAQIKAESKVEVGVAAIDITSSNAIAELDAALGSGGGYADVLVNNAGIGLAGPFEKAQVSGVLQLIDLNVRALTALTLHYLPGMLVRGRGGILNVASLGGYVPGPNQAAYYASKAYVLSLTEAIAAEVAGRGVRVCALAPGPVNTAFHARMGAETAFYRAFVPPASATWVARAGYLGFLLGLRVTIPGVINPFLAIAMRILPHRIVIPIVGWLLRPRESTPQNA
jgi:uncharacterized protein